MATFPANSAKTTHWALKPPHGEPNATSLTLIGCQMAVDRRKDISGHRSFLGKCVHFPSDSDFVGSIKFIPCVVMYMLVEFHDHRRWLIDGAWGTHTAACGGAFGLDWWCILAH